MATISVQTITIAGITPSYAAVAAGGDQFLNDNNSYVQIKNSSGSNSYTVTIDTPVTFGGATVSNPSVAIGTNGDKMFGPFPQSAFNDSAGYVVLTYTGSAPATDLKIGVFRHPRVDR